MVQQRSWQVHPVEWIRRSGTVPTWTVTIPPDIGCQLTSMSPTWRMISAIRSGPG
jgi:hypothetical protein